VGALLRAVGTLHDEEVDAAAGGPDAKEKAALVAKHRDDFGYFLQLVGKDALEGYSKEEQELLADPQAFSNRALLNILSRERQIEHSANNENTTRALIAAQLAVLSQQSSQMLGLELDPSSIPDDNLATVGKVAARILPYRLNYRRPAWAAAQGFNLFTSRWELLEASYEPTFGLVPDWALILPIGVYWHTTSPSSVGLFSVPGVLYRTHQALFAGADLGLRASWGFAGELGAGNPPRLGAELGFRVLGGKLRLSLAMDDVTAPSVGLGIGLTDFNGLLYWAVRIIEGQ
jgi:hypothetical protein